MNITRMFCDIVGMPVRFPVACYRKYLEQGWSAKQARSGAIAVSAAFVAAAGMGLALLGPEVGLVSPFLSSNLAAAGVALLSKDPADIRRLWP